MPAIYRARYQRGRGRSRGAEQGTKKGHGQRAGGRVCPALPAVPKSASRMSFLMRCECVGFTGCMVRSAGMEPNYRPKNRKEALAQWWSRVERNRTHIGRRSGAGAFWGPCSRLRGRLPVAKCPGSQTLSNPRKLQVSRSLSEAVCICPAAVNVSFP